MSNNIAGLPNPIPEDPADTYIQAEIKITIPELSKLYSHIPSCSIDILKKRSASEGWKAKRQEYWSQSRPPLASYEAIAERNDRIDEVVKVDEQHVARIKSVTQSIMVKMLKEITTNPAYLNPFIPKDYKQNQLVAIAFKKACDMIDPTTEEGQKVIQFIGFNGVNMNKV